MWPPRLFLPCVALADTCGDTLLVLLVLTCFSMAVQCMQVIVGYNRAERYWIGEGLERAHHPTCTLSARNGTPLLCAHAPTQTCM